MGEAMSRRIRGVFNAANFWAIVLYNVLSLNSLEFAKLVARRLIFKGEVNKDVGNSLSSVIKINQKSARSCDCKLTFSLAYFQVFLCLLCPC